MSLKSRNKPTGNQVELEFTIEKEAFDKAVDAAYRKNVGKMNVPGFRKGKAPKAIIEKMYGKGVFYDDALNALIPDAFEAALDEAGEKPVGQPEFDIVSLEGDVVIKAAFPVKPEVTVKNYKGYAVERAVAPTTDEEVDAEIAQVRSRNSRTVDITDRPAADGDIAVIDYEGFVDGKPFEGGKGEKHNLTLGSGQFIPGFEAQIVGHNPGDEFDVVVTFPEDYHAKELAGKEATFKTVLHEIKFNELPALDDDFAKDVSEFDTFDEYKADVKAKITDRHVKAADAEVEEKLIDALIDNLEADIPEAMFVNETENQLRDYDNRLRMQGLDLGTYLKYTGLDLDKMREQFRPRAERQVKTRLALEKIAELENLTVTDEDTEAEIKKIADMYGLETDKVKEQVSPDMLAEDIKVGKAVDIVKANAVITDKAPEAAE
ncbi:MAG: trigger factor [Eubacteriales bacterium]|uniref:Trigger factor n=1 Tax=Candidatus Colimorpha enterica TaxID=3083063 RepID=R6T9J0_9BACT|nr:trigger factor [Candidatus Colimorpha enterica]CDC70043.1 trigger factor [Candidatus Colimorpha enterica]